MRIRQRIGWVEIRERSRNAFFLATLAMFSSLPMFHYQFLYLGDHLFARQPTEGQAYYLALSQSFLVLVATFLSTLVSFLYRERLRLPRFGRLSDIRHGILRGLGAGLLLTPLIYFACDRVILRRIPALFPDTLTWALAHMAGTTIVQETIFRLGLMTIGIYFLRRWHWKGYPWPIVIPVSAFGALSHYLVLVKFNLVGILPPVQLAVSMALSLFFQWLYCHLYLRHGFIATSAFHLGVDVKLLVYAMIR